MDNQAVKQQLQNIYRQLISTYGPQHWWPAEEPFEVMVGASSDDIRLEGKFELAGLREVGSRCRFHTEVIVGPM